VLELGTDDECLLILFLYEGFMGALVIHPEAIKNRNLFPAESQAVCNAGLDAGYSIDSTEAAR
jgi:hypothetical protein